MSIHKNQEIANAPNNLQAMNADKEQRMRIREFDKELFSYTGQIAWFLPGIFSFLAMIMIFIPVQVPDSKGFYIYEPMFTIWISVFVLQPYLNTTEPFAGARQKIHRTYDKLKYLPVSRKQYNLVRLGYLFRYTWKLTVVGMFIQCLSVALFVGYVDIWNVVYVMAVLFVAPMLAGWLQIRMG